MLGARKSIVGDGVTAEAAAKPTPNRPLCEHVKALGAPESIVEDGDAHAWG